MDVAVNSSHRNNLPKALFFLLFIVLGITGLTFLINRYFVAPALTLKHPVTILVAGVDAPGIPDEFPRMDTLVLVYINPGDSKVNLISIPGTSRLSPSQPDILIGEAGGKEGIRKAGQLISGVTGTRIDHFIELNFKGFEQLVDMLDGIEVDVPRTIKYYTKDFQPIAEITPGRQILNGEQALLYIRYKDQKGEADRINRIQTTIKAILTKAVRSGNIFNAFKINDTVKKHMKTDLSWKDTMQLTAFVKSIDMQRDITLHMLPGNAEESYWNPDYPEIRRLMKRLGADKHQ